MKLWAIPVRFTFYVAAENEKEAEQVAHACIEEAVMDSPPHLWPAQVETIDRVETDWQDASPYTDDDRSEATCRQILEGYCVHGLTKEEGGSCQLCLEAAGQLRLM